MDGGMMQSMWLIWLLPGVVLGIAALVKYLTHR